MPEASSPLPQLSGHDPAINLLLRFKAVRKPGININPWSIFPYPTMDRAEKQFRLVSRRNAPLKWEDCAIPCIYRR